MPYDPAVRLTYAEEQELTDRLLNLCQGRWDWVLSAAIPEIIPVINGQGKRKAQCIFPDHGGADDMRTTNNFLQSGAVICTCTARDPVRGGINTVMRARQCDFKTARNLLLDVVGMGSYSPIRTPIPPPAAPRKEKSLEELRAEARSTKERIRGIWQQTYSISDPRSEPAMLWFENRGVTPFDKPFQNVRFHPGLPYFDGDEHLGNFPCIVSMMTDKDGFTRTIHRTFITDDGKKPPEIPNGKTRKLYTVPCDTTASGGAIKLDVPNLCLNLAEGLETALTVRRLTGLPTWSCVSKDMLTTVELPECVRYVTIWADKDRSDAGQQAAVALFHRLKEMGIKAVAMLPPGEIKEGKKGLDWNDLIIEQGVDAMRREWTFRQWQRAMDKLLGNEMTASGVHSRAFKVNSTL